ncbi:hypothetical protein AXW67_00130 [Bradyrhizobium neotropicale]|uniref:Uncharacterized protein n=1 Tax=Bradyrhizobium neotropicale TaxID=1497615 RepID=A0A176Z8C7_9BRAD|nr:hypothetical protein AXW67_00130 [Bradyrhizobium neotropicale]
MIGEVFDSIDQRRSVFSAGLKVEPRAVHLGLRGFDGQDMLAKFLRVLNETCEFYKPILVERRSLILQVQRSAA